MFFELSILIDRPPAEVFAFFRDKDKHPQEKGSAVLLLEKTTPGETGVGTRYREVVQMLPFYQGEILSEITRFEAHEYLEEDFWGAGMRGHLAYQFVSEGQGTLLTQRQKLHYRGVLRVLEPLISLVLGRRLRSRLGDIKSILENRGA
jgi:hypothetical protein